MNKRHLEIEKFFERAAEDAAPIIQSFSKSIRQWEESFRAINEKWRKFCEENKSLFEGLIKYVNISEQFRKTGWLPYRSAPFHFAEECGKDLLLFEKRLSDYYRTHWNDIRKDIEQKLENYYIDEEAKETFREALSAHEAGFYRSVCRLLLPEMERVFRVVFFGNKTGKIKHKKVLEKLTNGRDLEDFIMDNPFGLELFGILVRHLYEPVKTKNRKKFMKIPNRHAALHGTIVYSSMQNSFNTIVMADYVFQIVTQAMPSPP